MRIRLLLAASGCLVAAVLVRESTLEGRLLRADPNSIPDNSALMLFARERGEALFEIHCSACHGHGEADPERGVPSLADREWLYGTGLVSDIEQVIKYGIRSYHPRAWNLAIMPAYASAQPSARDASIKPLSSANIRDLVDFLLQKQRRGADL